MNTTTAAVAMNVTVATIDRTDSRAMPHTACPDVQPLPSRVPKPTSKPAGINHSKVLCVMGKLGDAKRASASPPSSKPIRNQPANPSGRSGQRSELPSTPLTPAVRRAPA